MKKRAVFISIIILIALILIMFLLSDNSLKKITGKSILEDKLVAYYKFEKNLNDSSNSNNLESKSSVDYSVGKIGRALKTDKRVYTASSLRPGFTNQISVVAWIQPLEDSKFSTIAHGSKTFASDWCDAFWLGVSTKSKTIYWKQDNTCGNLFKYSDELKKDMWIHVAGTYDGSKRKVYINGVEISEDTPDNRYITNNGLTVGRTSDGERKFNGSIDELRIYNRALSAEEINQLYKYTGKEDVQEIKDNETVDDNITNESVEKEIPGEIGEQIEGDIPEDTGKKMNVPIIILIIILIFLLIILLYKLKSSKLKNQKHFLKKNN